MSRNSLYLLIGLLAAALVVGVYLYDQQSKSGINIEIGESGVKIEGNYPVQYLTALVECKTLMRRSQAGDSSVLPTLPNTWRI